jgi:hypothetical protein
LPEWADLAHYAPCFLSGVLAWRLLKNVKTASLPWFFWPVALFSLTAFFFVVHTSWTRWICCLALGLLIPCFTEVRPRWLRIASHEVARYSYGIYLSHVIIFWLFKYRLAVLLTVPLRVVLFIISSVVVPVAVFHLLEDPMTNLGRKLAARLSAPALR